MNLILYCFDLWTVAIESTEYVLLSPVSTVPCDLKIEYMSRTLYFSLVSSKEKKQQKNNHIKCIKKEK